MNFFKGTGISGLRGMLPFHEHIVRPLLFARREELKTYAETNHLDYVEDSSNASEKYTRNYFRLHLIQDLKKVFPSVEDNLVDNIRRFRDIERLYKLAIDLQIKKLVEQKGNELHIPVLKLKKAVTPETLLYEISKEYGFSAAQSLELLNLLEASTGKYIQSSTHRVIRNRDWLIVTPLNTAEAKFILIEEDDHEVAFEAGRLLFGAKENLNVNLSSPPTIAMVDAAYIQFPLILRKYKQGDYFYPLGMKKKKKLNRFLIDNKLSLTEKENTWVIEMDRKIIWVVNRRIDDRFKISPTTKSILKIEYRQ
jgi:tRNA(Ile)-lysidine synthase